MPLIAGLGIGSILKTIIDSYILRRNFIKDRYYNEKKQSYLNLIESLYLINVDHSTKNLKNLVFIQFIANYLVINKYTILRKN